jgi:LysM repeat protein
MTPYRTAACVFAAMTAFLAACQTSGFSQRSASPDESSVANLRADMRILEERLNKVTGDVQVLQSNYDRLQQQVTGVQQQVAAIKSGGGATAGEIQRLESKIAAVDAARKKDAELIVNQVSAEIAKMSGGSASRRSSSSGATPPARVSSKSSSSNTETAPAAGGTEQGYEHVVEKGQTLSAIAKTYSVSVDVIKKANNLKDDKLFVGQKLFVPKQ